ncbi:MAG: biosynthetic-type acetolactate synthase large subunit, partial [Desulfosudaceae bacterium]
MKLTGAQIMMKALKEEQVDVIFGYPGGAVLDIYNELLNTDFRHILVRQEQGAVHAADAYARVSGKTGVCLVTSGPGATNTITGIASAYMDSIPVVIFTGQVPTPLIGNDAFQEVDIVGISRPCTKHNYLVKNVEDLGRTIREAFYIASSGRPGPVLIDIPKDVINAKATYNVPKTIKLKSYNPTYEPNLKQLRKVVELIKTARKPVIFSGGGILLSRASRELTDFAHTTGIPVTSSLMGLGAFPGTDPLWLGMPGMHGTFRANMSLAECDLLIAVGVRFDDRVTGKTDEFAAKATIVHVDIDPTSIHKNVAVDIPVVGDCRATLAHLLQLYTAAKEAFDEKTANARERWRRQIEEWKETRPLAYDQKEIIKPQYVVEKLYELTRGEAIITTEVGQNQMWAAQYYHYSRPGQFATSGGLGVMGYGLPAAIGAQVADAKATVIDIAGDGSIQMNIQEMMTAVSHDLPVKI